VTRLLEIGGLRAGYGRGGDILQGVDLELEQGQVLALLGRNGVGKTTLVHTVMGFLRPRAGTIQLGDRDLTGRPPHEIARAGVALVPQGRRIFSRLSVEENLKLARSASDSRERWTLDSVYDLLPRLRERRGHRGDQLSGGEQQMVALGRALLGNPRVILFDEPSEGLAPLIVDQVTRTIAELREEGLSAIVVEQNLHVALALADEVAIMTKGEIVYRAATGEFRRSPQVARTLLGISSGDGGARR
jgi:branched-chain amino acid transport system ATP-binding protein